MQPWQDTWSDECLRAGFKGRGADTAWYGAALEAEVRVAGGRPISIACLDLAKAFDYLDRQA
eukprot:4070720-Alexandrium_andersonii.AAC.1